MTNQRRAPLALSFLLYFLLLGLPGNATPDAVQPPRHQYHEQTWPSTLAPPSRPSPAKSSFSSGRELQSGHLNKRRPSSALDKVETKYIDVAFYTRSQYLEVNPQAIAQRDFKSFHWAIVTRSGAKDGLADAFDASNSPSVSQGAKTVKNPFQEGTAPAFLFQYKYGVKPQKANSLLARITLGKVKTSTEAITASLKEVPIPNCQESCVDWVFGAIKKMQKDGMLESFNVQDFSTKAFDYALNRRTILKILDDKGQPERFYDAKNAISQFQEGIICKKRPKM